MNRFNHREYSQFKNSLVSTYLSYCEYYRLTVTLLPLGNMWTPHILSLCLNQASLLHSGECAELCLLQEVDGVEAVHENTCQDGLPVHLWHPAGWPVWGCSNQTQGDLVGRSSWRNLAPLSRASACLLSSGVPFLIYNFFFTKWFVYNFAQRLVTCPLKWKESATTPTPCGGWRDLTGQPPSGTHSAIYPGFTSSRFFLPHIQFSQIQPRIDNGASKLEMSYKGDAISHFQRNIRRGSDVLRDHITKPMSALVEARSSLTLFSITVNR